MHATMNSAPRAGSPPSVDVLRSPGAETVLDAATIRELEPSLLGYAKRRVGREDLAEDLVQETWIAAMTSLPSFAGRSTLRTWLISILRRKIVDSFRRQKVQVAFDDHFHGEGAEQNEMRLDDEGALRVIEAELESLVEGERRAVTLCDVEGMDREEAARQMGVTRGHLRVLLHRGRLKLRESLEASRRVPLLAA
ncbi:MAG: RNA polymerase sigma factor [Polyangiaceae bacterium]|nr:RNA polymerase sigma factor [Polyangiaceae bacterium]